VSELSTKGGQFFQPHSGEARTGCSLISVVYGTKIESFLPNVSSIQMADKSLAELDAELAAETENFRVKKADLEMERAVIYTAISDYKRRLVEISRTITRKNTLIQTIELKRRDLKKYINWVDRTSGYECVEIEDLKSFGLKQVGRSGTFTRKIKRDDGTIITHTFTPLNVSFSVTIHKDAIYYLTVHLDNPDAHTNEFKAFLQKNIQVKLKNYYSAPFAKQSNYSIETNINIRQYLRDNYDVQLSFIDNSIDDSVDFGTIVKIKNRDPIELEGHLKFSHPSCKWYHLTIS